MQIINGHSVCRSNGCWWVDIRIMCVSTYQVAMVVGLPHKLLLEVLDNA